MTLEITKSNTKNTTVSNENTSPVLLFDIGFSSTKISFLNVIATTGVIFNNQLLAGSLNVSKCTFSNCSYSATTDAFYRGMMNAFTLQESIFENTTRLFNCNYIGKMIIEKCIFRKMASATVNYIGYLQAPYTIGVNDCIYENAINDMIIDQNFSYSSILLNYNNCNFRKISMSCGVQCQKCV